MSAFGDLQPQFRKDIGSWIKSGDLKYHETIHDGINSAPAAFIGLFSGANAGKMLVRLANA